MCPRPIRLQGSLIISICGRKQLVLKFFHRGSNQGKIGFRSTTVGWVWPGVSSHAHTCQNLTGVDFGWSGGCAAI